MIDVILAIVAATLSPGVEPPSPAVTDGAERPVDVQVNTGQADTGQATAQKADQPAQMAAAGTALIAEPQEATGRFTTALEVKPILAATQGNWIHVRDFNGQDLLYVTHLWSWRCGLAQIRLAVNGGTPEVWPLPTCHLDEGFPNMIKAEDGLPYRGYPSGEIQRVTVEVTYDDLSTETLAFGRNGQVLD